MSIRSECLAVLEADRRGLVRLPPKARESLERAVRESNGALMRQILDERGLESGARESCGDCEGHGRVECPECDGTGVVYCGVCAGDGKEPRP